MTEEQDWESILASEGLSAIVDIVEPKETISEYEETLEAQVEPIGEGPSSEDDLLVLVIADEDVDVEDEIVGDHEGDLHEYTVEEY